MNAMERINDRTYYSYSWHQSHDQATVLIMVPYETQTDQISVVIERNYLIVGVKGLPPIVKGRLYGNVDTVNSVWQLEPRASRLTGRERTASTLSTTSTHSQSSYAFVSDAEISSSFAASLESAHASDAEDLSTSPALSSPTLSSADERLIPPLARRNVAVSRSASPGHPLRSMPSSFSSLESLHSPQSSRLLTLHLEKDQSIIWPSLIVGPVPEYLSPNLTSSMVYNASHELEHQYNMDPTSLVLLALEYFDIRKDREEAFELFLRSWHQAHVPSATMRLASHYLPLGSTYDLEVSEDPAPRGTALYYQQCIGGREGVARLYLEAGLLHLEGAASTLLSASYSSLSSIRMPLYSQVGEGGAAAWKRDREAAAKYFDRARSLDPTLDIPALPPSDFRHEAEELEMPLIDVHSGPESLSSGGVTPSETEVTPIVRRRRKKEEVDTLLNKGVDEDVDNAWYLYVPSLVGAGTAILAVGVVAVLSFSSWSRRNQGS